MRVVLDTGVFFHPDALRDLARLPHDVAVPAVVFTERARQLAKRGIDPGDLLERLEANLFEVEPYGLDEARRFAPTLHDDEAWRRLARDAMIAGHVGPDDVLWTTNPSDFLEVGLAARQVMAVPPG